MLLQHETHCHTARFNDNGPSVQHTLPPHKDGRWRRQRRRTDKILRIYWRLSLNASHQLCVCNDDCGGPALSFGKHASLLPNRKQSSIIRSPRRRLAHRYGSVAWFARGGSIANPPLAQKGTHTYTRAEQLRTLPFQWLSVSKRSVIEWQKTKHSAYCSAGFNKVI